MADSKPISSATSFLQRWSARKQEARRQTEEARDTAAISAPEPERLNTVDRPSASQAALPDTEAKPFEQLSDADMPALDSLGEQSDYRQFFAPKVSAELRNLALRKLFHLPKFNIRDGLDDFDDDYTQFAPLGNTVTADMKHLLEVAQQREQEREQASEAALGEASEPEQAAEVLAAADPAQFAAADNDATVAAENNTGPEQNSAQSQNAAKKQADS